MLNIILFDSDARSNLLPLTATRPMGELRIGILTIREKWERMLRGSVSYITQEYLQDKYPIHIEEDNVIINAGVLPTDALAAKISALKQNEALLLGDELIAARLNEARFEHLIEDEEVHEMQGVSLEGLAFTTIEQLHQLTHLAGKSFEADFQMLTSGRASQPLSPSNQVVGKRERIFLEEGAKAECCIFNTNDGPIYIGKNAEVMEGSILRGPVSIGNDSMVKMGAKIYGPTIIGPGCRAGGEITRSILMANANKSHDGYLGDSVLGEWTNLGADTNNSNLKNNYSEVKLWNYTTEKFEKTGTQFCGMIMGDHAKCGINTMFNTGTVVGVFANVYGAGYPRNFVPDFAWGGGDGGYRTYRFNEACATAEAVMARRNIPFTEFDKAILYHIYDLTAHFRTWDK